MRNKFRGACALLAGLCLVITGAVTLAADSKNTSEAATKEQARPENTARPLPADTFKPSEEISEDFPVPFPVDI